MRTFTQRVPSFASLSLLALALGANAHSHDAAAPHVRRGLGARDDSHAFVDPVVLNPPALPNPKPAASFALQLPAAPADLSIPHSGAFLGFSVELSVSSQILGKHADKPSSPFINLVRNIAQRAGRVSVRVGGNTQEDAELVDSLGTAIVKASNDGDDESSTPRVQYTAELIELMSTISRAVDVGWYLGIPFGKDTNFDLRIAEVGQRILGDRLLGLQAANQPDYYARHGRRADNWGPQDFFNEMGVLVQKLAADSAIKNPNVLVGPSLALSAWTPQQVWDTGYIDAYAKNLNAISVERYPASNCADVKGVGKDVDPQELIVSLMTHKSVVDYIAPYYHSSELAQAAGKPFLMLEFNTGTCSGFPGLSNSFAAALWAIDAGLQMAYHNFSSALLHVGGKNAYYNPFTPPPYAEADYHQWTIGPVYYSALVLAEAFGHGGAAQVVDLQANGGSDYTPAYAVYESGAPTRVALFNLMSDKSGGSDVTARVAVPAGVSSVKVKYLKAESVVAKSGFTWAGQTFGNAYESNGIPTGNVDVQTVACADGACAVTLPAPSFALVFLSDQALADSTPTALGAASNRTSSSSGTATSTGKGGKATGTGTNAATDGTNSGAGVVRAGLGAVLGAVLIGCAMF